MKSRMHSTLTRFAVAPAALALVAAALLPAPAMAHHPMGGAAPMTAWEGFASGVAHPMIGLDHLAFLLAAGALAAAWPHRGGVRWMLALLAATLGGALLHLGGWALGPVEALVAASVIAAGLALAVPAGRLPPLLRLALAFAFALAGGLHGYAYAEAVAGSPPLPVVAYLATLTAMQALLAGGAMLLARGLLAEASAAAWRQRLAAAAVTLVGAAALATALFA